jgi:LmbE family N-acetylglucosaminyl deacetylase
MIALSLPRTRDGVLKVLCLGCHADDIEIGCGGTILRLASEFERSEFHWVVFSAPGDRAAEARRGAELFAGDRVRGPHVHAFRDGFMPYVGADVKAVFEDVKNTYVPNVVFTHNSHDAHQDHRLVSELTWNTFRDHFILEYEIPKYDGDLGRPSVFVPLDAATAQRKVAFLADAFQSQQTKRWFEESTFRSLMRLRGMECNSPSGYAEAFYCRKLVL